MYKIKRILAALDLTDNDHQIIEYLDTMSTKLPIEKVYFLNVQSSLEIPEEILKKYPELLAPKDESIKQMITSKIKSYGKHIKTEYDIDVIDGNTTKEILKYAKRKEVDLILLGKKLGFHHHAISSSKVLKLAPCSVAVIPDNTVFEPHEFVVPVDFSKNSKIALEHAILISSHFNDVQLTCVHFYRVPSGYHYSGKSREEFAEIMKSNAEKSYKKFMKSIDTKSIDVQVELFQDDTDDVAQRIFDFALDRQASGIVIGSKGRTLATSLILGSVADKLVRINTHLPIFVAKNRNQNMGILDAIIDG